eukprot:g14606.t1
MEGILSSAIKQDLLSNNLLSDTQFGFHQGHSAPDLITALVQTWTKELNSRGKDVSAGVPQGIVLGPTMYSCFINDLPSII